MKNLAAFIGFFALSSGLASAGSVYECTGGSFDPIKVEVKSKSAIVINDKDVAKIDADYAKKNPDAKKYKMIGNFTTLGDGAEGFSVDVSVSTFLFAGSRVAYLNTYNRGPEGYYSDSYKCVLR